MYIFLINKVNTHLKIEVSRWLSKKLNYKWSVVPDNIQCVTNIKMQYNYLLKLYSLGILSNRQFATLILVYIYLLLQKSLYFIYDKWIHHHHKSIFSNWPRYSYNYFTVSLSSKLKYSSKFLSSKTKSYVYLGKYQWAYFFRDWSS